MIYEVIVTTLNDKGEVHIAPMGIRNDDEYVIIAPFKPSQTLENIRTTRTAVVNITDDVRVFAGCLTGRKNWLTYPAKNISGRVLQSALFYQELQLENEINDSLRPQMYMSEVSNSMAAPFLGFNRAQAAVLEAAILVSRLHFLPGEKVDSEMDYLSIAIEKTAGEREREAWSWLTQAIANYRNQSCS